MPDPKDLAIPDLTDEERAALIEAPVAAFGGLIAAERDELRDEVARLALELTLAQDRAEDRRDERDRLLEKCERLTAELAEARSDLNGIALLRRQSEIDRYAAEKHAAALKADRDKLRSDLAEERRLHAITRDEMDALGADMETLGRAIDELERANSAMRPVAEAAAALVDDWAYQRATHGGRLRAAVDAYRSAAPPTSAHHRYLSTACLHAQEPGREDLHLVCQTDAKRYDGTHKVSAQCKWCPSMCVCECHRPATPPVVPEQPTDESKITESGGETTDGGSE